GSDWPDRHDLGFFGPTGRGVVGLQRRSRRVPAGCRWACDCPGRGGSRGPFGWGRRRPPSLNWASSWPGPLPLAGARAAAGECGAEYELQATHVCEVCFGPLDAVYDKQALKKVVSRSRVEDGPKSMWRYRDLLPIDDSVAVVTLGEGLTPLVHAERLGAELG